MNRILQIKVDLVKNSNGIFREGLMMMKKDYGQKKMLGKKYRKENEQKSPV